MKLKEIKWGNVLLLVAFLITYVVIHDYHVKKGYEKVYVKGYMNGFDTALDTVHSIITEEMGDTTVIKLSLIKKTDTVSYYLSNTTVTNR